ncbi:MAG: uracil-DNA glycosylase family protein [Ginsengibacter sp.]
MRASELFESYKEEVSKVPDIEAIFSNSGLTNTYGLLDFGFFPLGSGVFKEGASKIGEAEISECKIMVLGNDFGTKEYIDKQCLGNREKPGNPTIRNLLKGLDLDVETTFFTNLFLGLRTGGTNIKRAVPIQEDYKEFCFDFFKKQLDFLDPEIVLCLGKDVGNTLSAFSEFSNFKKSISELFEDEMKKEYIVNTDDEFFGQRRFILIPHPSFAHINWKGDDIKNKIKRTLAVSTNETD